ncbi:FAD dependent oxidoreductase [Epithele typhae]|uniref:FAD dependent oxidoreductase n=1 Tax=Epithele typhae TaxID=378194 RepID=UPI002008BE64|nr:FAD dependent oxidoreductase [Epithele typhae]KAH9928536.1 FAD dependent oxidoreductase [Epithele typhae]
MVAPLTHDSPILVFGGGGTLGSSTALHLARRGYRNVRVLDVYPLPSAQSAGNDLNKIMGTSLRNPVDRQLSAEAEAMWAGDATFREFYHRTGRIDCSGSPEGIKGVEHEYEKLKDAGLGHTVEWLDGEDAIVRRVPQLTGCEIKGWKGIWFQEGGWLAARKAIDSVGRELAAHGVQFSFGESGAFQSLILSDDRMTCLGAVAKDGTRYLADRVVLATGAWSPALVDLEEQCCSKAWVYAHLQLTSDEVKEYAGCPVVYNEDIGFFFEPDDHGVIKVCDEFPGFTRYKTVQPFGAPAPTPVSVPRSHAAHPTDTYPDASEATIRRAVSTFLPRFADRPLFNRALCWCTDTADANLLVCEHPRWAGFVLATGDSGHSFKLLPIIGKYVVDLLEGTLQEDCSRRAAPAKDLADMPGWNHDGDNKVVVEGAEASGKSSTACVVG